MLVDAAVAGVVGGGNGISCPVLARRPALMMPPDAVELAELGCPVMDATRARGGKLLASCGAPPIPAYVASDAMLVMELARSCRGVNAMVMPRVSPDMSVDRRLPGVVDGGADRSTRVCASPHVSAAPVGGDAGAVTVDISLAFSVPTSPTLRASMGAAEGGGTGP